MIVASIIRFALITQIKTFAGIALTVYLLIFAAIFINTQASVLESRKWFYFLNFGWGNGVAHLFVACIMLGSGAAILWLDVIVGIYLILCSIWLSVTTWVYWSDEEPLVTAKLEQIQKLKDLKNGKQAAISESI